jgi:hypothetical protein
MYPHYNTTRWGSVSPPVDNSALHKKQCDILALIECRKRYIEHVAKHILFSTLNKNSTRGYIIIALEF